LKYFDAKRCFASLSQSYEIKMTKPQCCQYILTTSAVVSYSNAGIFKLLLTFSVFLLWKQDKNRTHKAEDFITVTFEKGKPTHLLKVIAATGTVWRINNLNYSRRSLLWFLQFFNGEIRKLDHPCIGPPYLKATWVC